jgi:hypothetical protein
LTAGDAFDADRRLNLIAQEMCYDFFGDRYPPRRVLSGSTNAAATGNRIAPITELARFYAEKLASTSIEPVPRRRKPSAPAQACAGATLEGDGALQPQV